MNITLNNHHLEAWINNAGEMSNTSHWSACGQSDIGGAAPNSLSVNLECGYVIPTFRMRLCNCYEQDVLYYCDNSVAGHISTFSKQ